MTLSAQILQNQLNQACQEMGSNWAAWLKFEDGKWSIANPDPIALDFILILEALLVDSAFIHWLNTLQGEASTLAWKPGKSSANAKEDSLFAFPHPEDLILLVSAKDMDPNSRLVFRLLSMVPPTDTIRSEKASVNQRPGFYEQNNSSGTIVETINSIPELSTGITLENIVKYIAGYLADSTVYFAARRGESISVEAVWPSQIDFHNFIIPIHESPILSSIFEKKETILLEGDSTIAPKGLSRLTPDGTTCWLGIPVSEGSRIIGIFAFASTRLKPFSKDDIGLVTAEVSRISNIVEHAIYFEEATHYLQHLALLNELAAVASSGLDIEEVTRRILERLKLIFESEWAAIYLLSSDLKSLLDYGVERSDGISQVIVSENDILGRAVKTGLPIRIDYLEKPNQEKPLFDSSHPKSKSRYELCMPIKYRGQVIGAITIRRYETKTFSTQDEQFLFDISSHLAGVFESMRLNRETQERAEILLDTIHQLEAARETARRSQNALIQAEKMATSGRLMATIAHEINNPLQAVQNCLHLVSRAELSPEIRESYLHMAQDELIRLMNTVKRMLEFFRPGSLDKKPVDVHSILLKTLELARKFLDDSGVSVTLNLAAPTPHVMAVSDQLQQVFLNLILNAGQAMKDGGAMRIETLLVQTPSEQEQVEILFKDSGPGIPAEDKERIFEPFFSSKDGGMGLGLAVSYGIISAHEGTLENLDNSEPGACFRILLKTTHFEKTI